MSKSVDIGKSKKITTQNLRVSLRGKLAQDYTKLRNKNEEAATKWIRQLCRDALGGHPQLGYRIEADKNFRERLVVGLKKEKGTMGDW
jgi:hypothetical protein